jgi:hypothetical protein
MLTPEPVLLGPQTRRTDMDDRMIDGDAPLGKGGANRPLWLTSRCRLTPKGRLSLDPARRESMRREAASGARLNATGRYVIERCDGSRSVAEIARNLASKWQIPEARASHDVLAFLSALREQGLVQFEDDGELTH